MSRKKIKETELKAVKRKSLLSIASILAVCGFAGTACSYLLCINDLSVRGFELRELKKTSEALAAENESLELEAADLDSLSRVESDTAGIGMVAAGKLEFIPALDENVARR